VNFEKKWFMAEPDAKKLSEAEDEKYISDRITGG
jgi:hypothetical protein